MTDPDTTLAPRDPALVDRTQPLGILPTLSFWDEPANRKLIRWPMAVLAGVLPLAVVSFLSLPWWGSGLVAAGTMVLSLGLFERYIRMRVKARRRALGC